MMGRKKNFFGLILYLKLHSMDTKLNLYLVQSNLFRLFFFNWKKNNRVKSFLVFVPRADFLLLFGI